MENDSKTFSERMAPSKSPREGKMTTAVEQYTSQLPSMTWLWLAAGSMALSAGLAAFREKKGVANFVGLWVPSLLLIGIYNKLVKLEGSDRRNPATLH